MVTIYLKEHLPEKTLDYLRNLRAKLVEARRQRLPALSEDRLKRIIVEDLGLKGGDVVFVHSSTNELSAAFPVFRVLQILQEVVGREGTLLFPTYPRATSYVYLMNGEIFDVRKTASYTGLLTEFARRQRGARRSLHPTKSVCAIGPRAEPLT